MDVAKDPANRGKRVLMICIGKRWRANTIVRCSVLRMSNQRKRIANCGAILETDQIERFESHCQTLLS
jgi:hypothetical protein